jgi:1,2-phenylacetyl-CoA epoxidase catalytic subunit
MEKLQDMVNQKIQDALKKYQDTTNKKHKKTQKQINKFREDIDKLQSERKETILEEIYEMKPTQDIKEEFNKDTENFRKKNQTKTLGEKKLLKSEKYREHHPAD